MLEYVFFAETPRRRFQDFLTGQGLAWSLEPEGLETLVIVDEAGMDDELAERVESFYDELAALEQPPSDAGRPDAVRVADPRGVVIQLRDGRAVRAPLPQELVARVLTVVTAEEFGILVDLIARAVENPDAPGL